MSILLRQSPHTIEVTSMDTDIKSFSIDLQTMRHRPAMFLSPVSVSAFWHFILGYGLGQGSVSTEAKNPFTLPSDFHDWVAYRLHFFESTSGWHNMIIERLGDGPHALDRFFSLLDEYLARVPQHRRYPLRLRKDIHRAF